MTVGANNHVVRHRAGLEGDLTADQVGEGNVLIGHAQAQNRLTTLGAIGSNLLFAKVAVKTVVTELGVFTLGQVTSLNLFWS